ncbi:crotonobetainyl-CoA--carnitine CoA-transferase [Heliobacillus mobilis]|uniref:Crotonobetainyl-CoA--carnitine CoA-transferase n=1 Tax=Heliobacterium mobile TaxID=28064 RepID=A0A6I3SL37_HELMO|nr:TylF/MycF/NovP-related O-methyltransferase [Heliobacterium mobile]MTV49688.1 crotonobetainyl-CoA--carnitine CoA-transferase [Heliobacterium mobile]
MIKKGYESSKDDRALRRRFFELYKDCPIPEDEVLSNLGLFIARQKLARIMLMNDLYKMIVPIPGVVMEFGCRYGQNLALFSNFRGMYEPFNHSRKIIGFDTFEGFPHVDEKDGNAEIAQQGFYSVPKGYEQYLHEVMDYHEKEAPLAHIKKFELVKGDCSQTVEKYLNDNPETVVALAYFDLDLYRPTKDCLSAIQKHLIKGSVLAFDDVNLHDFPGETIAIQEFFGLNSCRLLRSPYSGAFQTYMVVE